MDETYHVKLIQKKTGIYTIYVFQKDNGEYIMCTQLPNWGVYNIHKSDTGFLTITIAKAGETYFERSTNSLNTYRFDQCYFKEWVPDTEIKPDIIL